MGIRVNAAISAIENLVKTNYTRRDGVKMVKTEFDRILKNGARQNVTVYRSAERGAAKTTMHIKQDFESLKRVYDQPQLWETGVYDRIAKQSHDLYKTGYQETYQGLIPDGSAIPKVLETKQVTSTPIVSYRGEGKFVKETRRKSAILNDNPHGDATMLTYRDQYIAGPYGINGLTAGQCTIGKSSYSSKGLHKTKPVTYATENGLKRLNVASVKNNNKQTRLLLGNETPEQLRAMGFNPVPYDKIN